MTEPCSDDRPESDRASAPLGDAVIIGVVLLLAAAGTSWWATLPAPATSRAGRETQTLRYVGSEACGECHPGEYAHYSRSGHARTLRPAAVGRLARRLDGRQVEDPEQPGLTWRYGLRDGKLAVDRAVAGKVKTLFLEYAFGSGRHARTFLTLLDRNPEHPVAFEHRLSYFAHAGGLGLDVTPGQSLRSDTQGNTPDGRVHTPDDTVKCFGCHATTTSDRGLDVLDAATMIPNVTCERCHGPGGAHAEAARRGAGAEQLAMPLGPGRETAAEQLKRCGACHRLPLMVRPGTIRTDNPVLVRHQPVGLLQSACYRRSRGVLGCMTCHDPHARVSTDRSGYEAACLACHRAPSRTSCPVSPYAGCIACHMPRRDVARGMMMTDHWIRIVPELDPRRGRRLPPAGAPGQQLGRPL